MGFTLLSTWLVSELRLWAFDERVVPALRHIEPHPDRLHLLLLFLHRLLQLAFPLGRHHLFALEDVGHLLFVGCLDVLGALLVPVSLSLLYALLFQATHCLPDGVPFGPLEAGLNDFHLLFLRLLDAVEGLSHEVVFHVHSSA